MSKSLTIAVLRDRYPTQFNTPRLSRHCLKPILFLPANRLSRRIEGLTLTAPARADLLHAVNRIPAMGRLPFVMSFESHLPRCFGGEHTALYAFMRRRLASDQCRRIVAMSRFARNIFLRQHAATPEFDRLAAKLEVIYPNIHLPAARPATQDSAKGRPLKLAFIGAHFGRKGGAVAAVAARIARERKLPLHVTIVSSLQAGAAVWSDPTEAGFFAPYFRLLDAANVTFLRGLPNREVATLLRGSDFTLLTTFSDTFGYSAVESLAAGTPVIATAQGALPEFIADQSNGFLIPLEVNQDGEWAQIGRADKHAPAYAALYRDEIERLARAVIALAEPYIDAPDRLRPLREAARRTAETLFDTVKTSAYLDELYERCTEKR